MEFRDRRIDEYAIGACIGALLVIIAVKFRVFLETDMRTLLNENVVVIDTTKVDCLPFNMGITGWEPVWSDSTLTYREKINRAVANGKREWMRDYTIDCYKRDPYSPELGEKVATLGMEWSRRIKK